ncbi:MAG: SLATT domain-containing protein [Clostridia bacterium]|nr:SLATT domain-containing protein [Clostridia bacterium]
MKKYDSEKYYRMIKKKQLVFTHQLKRLSKANKRASFVLIYYSIMIIVYSLSLKFFPNYFCNNLVDFFNIVLSVIVLIYSIINSNSRYSERVRVVENALSKIKKLKRKLADVNEINNEEDKSKKFDEIKIEYEDLIDSVEYRDDLDFYYAVLNLCKSYNINPKNGCLEVDKQEALTQQSEESFALIQEEIKIYLAEINPAVQKLNILIHRIWHVILYLAPIVIYIMFRFWTKVKGGKIMNINLSEKDRLNLYNQYIILQKLALK